MGGGGGSHRPGFLGGLGAHSPPVPPVPLEILDSPDFQRGLGVNLHNEF